MSETISDMPQGRELRVLGDLFSRFRAEFKKPTCVEVEQLVACFNAGEERKKYDRELNGTGRTVLCIVSSYVCS